VLPLTYTQASAFPADVLADGRILFEAGFPLGTGATPELFLVYADGSGVESYRCDHGRARWGGRQLASGDVIFTHGASLARFTSPLAHEELIAAPHAEYAGAIAETASGAWLVSARAAAGTPYALKLWKPGAAALQTLLAVSGKNIIEPVLIAPRSTPKRHPSGLHDWSYANMLALDARQSRMGDLKAAPASVRLEMHGRSRPHRRYGHGAGRERWFFFCEDACRQADSFCAAGCKGRGDAPGARMVLDSPRRTAHLRWLPHGTGARVGKSRARRAAAHDNAG
jgi:hypothetical protein